MRIRSLAAFGVRRTSLTWIGIGVGGARGAMQSGHMSEEDFYVIAKNAPLKNLTDGKGVDHLFPTLMTVGGHCFEGAPPTDDH